MYIIKSVRKYCIVLALLSIFIVACSSFLLYDLTVYIDPTGSGTVDPSSGSYSPGTIVTLTATPNTGYVFVEWGGDLSGTNNPSNITINSDIYGYAEFKLDLRATFTITSWNQPYYSSLGEWGMVEVYYDVENICSNKIDSYEAYFEVTCSDGSVYSDYDLGFDLQSGKKYAELAYINIGQKQATSIAIVDYDLTAY